MYLLQYDQTWELSRDNLVIGDYIGEGEFGRVMKAQYRKCLLDDWSAAAVKMLKGKQMQVLLVIVFTFYW